jgi:hypothetical protein
MSAQGIGRTLLMARFLQTAPSAELGGVVQRVGRAEPYDDNLLSMVWERWVEVDLESALHSSDSSAPWEAWAKLKPQAALDAALKESPPEHLEAVLRGIAGSDPALASKTAAQHPELEGHPAQNEIFMGLAKKDPPAAMKAALEISPSMARSQMQSWLREDPEAARAWLRSLTDPGQRRLFEAAALDELTGSDPAAAIRAAASLPLGARQTQIIGEAMAELARQDPAAARAAAGALPTPYARSQALVALAGSLADRDAGAATALISSIDWNLLKDTGPARWEYTGIDGKSVTGSPTDWEEVPQDGKTTRSLLTKLMSSDPARTAETLAALPEASGAPVAAAIGVWAGQQPEAASAWVRDLPAGPARDSGIEGLTAWLTKDSPEPDFPAAVEWARSASPDRQFGILQQTFNAWKQVDPEAARQAIEQEEDLPLTPQQREILILSLP